MNHRWLLTLSFALTLGCTPADDNNTPGSGGAGSGTGGRGGSGSGGSGTGGSVGTGGNTGTGGSVSTGGSTGTGGSGSGGATGTGGSGNDGGAADGSSSGSGGAPGTGGAGGPDGGASMGGPAGVLDNYVITVPCPAGANGGSCNIATDVRAFDKALKFGGDPTKTYKVTLKICALYETRPYMGCSAMPQPRHCVNGTPGTGGFAATYPTLGLKVADPMATHWLNGMYQADTIVRIDYTTTIDIKGGSALNFVSDGGSNGGVYSQRMKPAFMPCPDVPGITQPFSGQFAHFKVMSVEPPM